MKLAAAISTALAALALGACQNSESYCGNLYRDDGPGTPKWANGQFNDRASCIDWWERQQN